MKTEKQNPEVTYHAGLYARISVETAEKEERDTIGLQVKLLREYASGIDNLLIEEVYIDDDESGVNFSRPAFERMINDAERGRINTIIVKDLSRFARNHIGAGMYLEKLFPKLNVRFIAINDGVDTLFDDGGIMVPIKNVINEQYARETSQKLLSTFKTLQRAGEFCSAKPPFGYKVNSVDKHRLEIDDEKAEVVRQVFDLFLQGKSIHEICVLMNFSGTSVVRRILSSRVYCGDSVSNKYSSMFLETGVKKARKNDEEEFIVVENMHDPIISHEDWERVRERLSYNKLHYKEIVCSKKKYLLSGIIVCAHCGSKMTVKKRRTKGGDKYFYVCPKHDSFGVKRCDKRDIPMDICHELVSFFVENRYPEGSMETVIKQNIASIMTDNEGSFEIKFTADVAR